MEKFVASVLALLAAVTFCLLMLLLQLLLVLELLDIREYGERCLEHVVEQPGIQLHGKVWSKCAYSACRSYTVSTVVLSRGKD